MDAVRGADHFPVAHIAFADVLHAAFAVPISVDAHEWTAAVPAYQQTSVSVAGGVAGRGFALALLEQDLDF